MKRDMDLVRTILLAVESCEDPWGLREVKIEGQSHDVVQHHLMLLVEAGLISGSVSKTTGGINVYSARLTWPGHEFLDAARSDTIWNRAKTQVKDKVGTAGLGLLIDVLKHQAKQALGIP